MAPNADATPSHGPSSDWDSKNFIERSAWRITRWHVASPCISFCSVFSFIIALVIAAAVAPTGLGNSEVCFVRVRGWMPAGVWVSRAQLTNRILIV